MGAPVLPRPSNQFQYQAGPRSSYRLISCSSTGVSQRGRQLDERVFSDRVVVRSMTSMVPDASPSISAVRAFGLISIRPACV